MKFRIFPFKGAAGIRFGMPPTEVRENFKVKPEIFKRNESDIYPCDYYESEGVFFYYDKNHVLEAIEFAFPSEPQIDDINLLKFSYEEAVSFLSAIDSDVKQEADGAIAYKIGISIYAPLGKDDHQSPIQSVLAFRPGYYDEN